MVRAIPHPTSRHPAIRHPPSASRHPRFFPIPGLPVAGGLAAREMPCSFLVRRRFPPVDARFAKPADPSDTNCQFAGATMNFIATGVKEVTRRLRRSKNRLALANARKFVDKAETALGRARLAQARRRRERPPRLRDPRAPGRRGRRDRPAHRRTRRQNPRAGGRPRNRRPRAPGGARRHRTRTRPHATGPRRSPAPPRRAPEGAARSGRAQGRPPGRAGRVAQSRKNAPAARISSPTRPNAPRGKKPSTTSARC